MDDVKSSMFHVFIMCKGKEAKFWNRYNQVPHLIQDTVWENDKYTKDKIQESKEVSPFLAGDHKTAWHRQDNIAQMNT